MRTGTLLAILFIVPACWASSSGRPAPVNRVEPPAPATAPSSLVGTWVGTGTQYDDSSTWTVEMSIVELREIGSIGTITYPSLNCSADLYRESDEGDRLVLREILVTGPDVCVDGGAIKLPRNPATGSLDWRWFYPDGNEGAKAALERR